MRKLCLLSAVLLLNSLGGVTLQDCLAGLRTDSPVTANLQSVEQQQIWKQKALQTAYYPTLYVNGEAGMNSEVTEMSLGSALPLKAPQPDKDREAVGLELRQLIWDGGMVRGQKQLTELEAKLKTYEFQSSLNALEMEVVNRYYTIISLGLSMKATRLHLQSQNARLETTQAGLINGLREKADVLLLRSDIIGLEDKLSELGKQRQIAIDRINRLCGLELNASMDFDAPSFAPILGNELHKPELEKLGIMAEMQEVNAKLALRKNLPNISARFSGAWGKPGYDMFSTEFHEYYSAGVQLSWKIWDWGQRSYEHRAARQEAEQLLRSKENVEIGIKNELAAIDRESAQVEESIRSNKDRLALQKQLLQIYEEKYTNGLISTTELLVQSNKLLSAELELLASETQLSALAAKRIYTMGDRL